MAPLDSIQFLLFFVFPGLTVAGVALFLNSPACAGRRDCAGSVFSPHFFFLFFTVFYAIAEVTNTHLLMVVREARFYCHQHMHSRHTPVGS